jgi:hypothetical protein
LDAGLTQDSVADQMDWHTSKIIRIENGAVAISKNDLMALLRLYEISDPQRVTELDNLAKAARQRPWYSEYREVVSSVYFQYIEYEAAAAVMSCYYSGVVPGLLQTEAYASKVIELYPLNVKPDVVQGLIKVRMRRQQLLFSREDVPPLFFVMDEAVIHRLLGDEETRRGQLNKLIDLAKKPGVSIEIVPFSVGLHRGMAENFTILQFDSASDDDVLFFESARDAMFSHDNVEEISIYRELFEHLREISLGPEKSLDFLISFADTLPY